MVDFCSTNNSWGVYIGGTTDLNTVVSITDTATGKVSRAFVNPLGQDFQLVKSAEFSCSLGPVVGQVSPGTTSANVIVPGTASPWQWVNGGLNSNFQHGMRDGTAPIVVDQTSGISFTFGAGLVVVYVSGSTTEYSGEVAVDANGAAYVPVDDTIGASGNHFPSSFIAPSQYPANLGVLIGTFTDGSGQIMGTPFKVGNGPTYATVSSGASRLQLGINDDQLSDNTGSLVIQVSQASGGGCSGTPTGSRLPLVGGRFVATLNYFGYGANPPVGAGTGYRLTDNVGYFGTVDPTSADVAVKMVDFCSLNGTWGVYIGGTTDLNTTVTITDTLTGKVSQPFVNTLGHDFKLMKAGVFTCP